MENISKFSIMRNELAKLYTEYKVSMAVPLPEEIKAQMAKEGVFALLNKNQALPTMGKEQIQEILNNLKETKATDFFQTLDINTALQLPYILKPNNDNLVEIDGKQYYMTDVSESRPIKKKQTINNIEYQKGDNYPGEVILMDLETGNPVTFTFDEIKNKIKSPSFIKEETLNKVNEEISIWNKKVEAIEKATGVSKLNLQISSAESKIKERIQQLNSQKESLTKSISNPLEISPAYGTWMSYLKNNYQTFGARDIFDTLLFLYQSNPQELVKGIESGEVKVPEEIKSGLISIANQEVIEKQQELDKQKQKQEERTIRKESPITEEKEPKEIPLQPLTIEEIPEKKYKTPSQYKTLYSWSSSLKRAISGIEEDLTDLQNILSSLDGLRKYIAALEKGQRSTDYLKSQEGQSILNDMKKFLDACSLFFKRYSVDVIQDGKLNPKLLGRTGTIGNSLIAARLNAIYNVIKKTIDEVEMPVELTEQQKEIKEPIAEPVANSQNKIKRMSELLWKAFQNRMDLK